jgi:hypothetical protein
VGMISSSKRNDLSLPISNLEAVHSVQAILSTSNRMLNRFFMSLTCRLMPLGDQFLLAMSSCKSCERPRSRSA